ncbi:xanthine dehydrogenase family protein subunit M [Streptacidiphilus sp. N1-12]|uniref:Xanthine dehydrogenase family protein subunit M n=2 Tax=Streptacidiphilus alkalitolerans TaxID=3342712 RepID=A0ABV6V3G3_9ACTN
MILTPFDFARPTTVDEATALLARTAGSRPLAGGQSLLVDLSTGEAAASLLVDLAGLPGLRGVRRREDGGLSIGATTTLAELAVHPEVLAAAPALAQAARANGDPQVRNRGTVGGNLVADRSGVGQRPTDLPVAALAVDAVVTVVDADGSRSLPVERLAAELRPGSLVTSLELPAPDSAGVVGSAFEKSADRASLYPLCAVAVRIGAAGYRVAVTGATAGPVRLTDVETRLAAGRTDIPSVLAAFAAQPIGLFTAGRGGSAEYLRHLAGVLTARALARAAAAAA